MKIKKRNLLWLIIVLIIVLIMFFAIRSVGAVEVEGWVMNRNVDEMDDVVTYSLVKLSNESVENLNERYLWVMFSIMFDENKNAKAIGLSHRAFIEDNEVRWRVDKKDLHEDEWIMGDKVLVKPVDNEELKAFIQELKGGQTLLIEYNTYDEGSFIAKFDLDGFEEKLDELGW